MAEPIFTDPIHLSELNIYPAADSLYVLGEVLAVFNAGGQFFYPDFLNNFRFDRNKGRWLMIKSKNRHEGKIDPEVASWQFRGSVSEMNKNFLRGFLGGYARRAYQIVDPICPGFTDDLIAHLVRAPVLSVTKPREKQLDLAKLLANYGLGVTFKKDSARPSFSEVPREVLGGNDYELVVATIVITLAKMDVTQWIQQVENMDATQEMPRILGGLMRREYESSWDGAIAGLLGLTKKKKQFEALITHQPAPLLVLLLFVQDIYRLKQVPDDGIFGEAFTILKKTVATFINKSIPDWYSYVEAMVDGLNYLAQAADQQGNAMTSISLAQASTILLQFLAKEETGLEGRLSRAELPTYSWANLAADSSSHRNILLNYVACRNSVSTTYLQCFFASHELFKAQKATNHLWTAIWNSRRMQRATIIFLYELSSQTEGWTEDEKAHIFTLLKHAFNIYLNGQRKFTDVLVSYNRPNQIMSHYANCFTGIAEEDATTFLTVEQTATLKLYQALKADTLDADTLIAWQELVAAIKKIA